MSYLSAKIHDRDKHSTKNNNNSMNKATLLACVCAVFVGAQSLAAQEANEVTYVSDPTQGVLLNRMQDNWFITAEVGANINFPSHAIHRDLSDRFSPAAGLYVGKHFTPIFGARVGFSYYQLKGLATGENYIGVLRNEYRPDGYYKQLTNEFGGAFDIMVNLTNWWCGYKPNRVYNATVYAGAGAYFTMAKKYDRNGKADGWSNAEDLFPALRAGLINTFNLSKQVALSIDIRWTAFDGLQNEGGANWNEASHNLSAFLGLTYKFKNREWEAPVVPVCPPAENCDALRARLSAADARISDLEGQLRASINRTVPVPECEEGPLATVYYPIGVSRLSRENSRVVRAIANVMNSEQYANSSFVITGWADNYTGTDAINDRLRTRRAEGVRDLLVENGVSADRLEVTTNPANLMGEGDQYVALDRAVTITER